MVRIFLSIAITMTCLTTFSQTIHKSIKYGYTVTIPKGWKLSDNINFKNVDTKIVDGKGNSFVVAVEVFDEIIPKTAKEMFEELSTAELEEMYKGIFGEGSCTIIKRGTTFISGKEFYYIHSLGDTKNGQMLHKMFVYCNGNKNITINAACFNSKASELIKLF